MPRKKPEKGAEPKPAKKKAAKKVTLGDLDSTREPRGGLSGDPHVSTGSGPLQMEAEAKDEFRARPPTRL